MALVRDCTRRCTYALCVGWYSRPRRALLHAAGRFFILGRSSDRLKLAHCRGTCGLSIGLLDVFLIAIAHDRQRVERGRPVCASAHSSFPDENEVNPMFVASLRRLTRASVLALTVGALGCAEDTESPFVPNGEPILPATASATLTFRQVSAGGDHTCGVTSDDQAYCWGDNNAGQVGDGSPTPQFCMDWPNCVTEPVAVVGGLRFRAVSAGFMHTCGVTTDDRVYCWGWNSGGELGIGTATGPETCDGNEADFPCSSQPVAVKGGLRFRNVSAGSAHTCGISTDGLAYCWGNNSYGQLGDVSTTRRLTPRLVAGGHQFRSLSAGSSHTCGVTVDYRAYCWGSNSDGQLGDSTQVARRLQPVRVAGGRQFQQLDAGSWHTCAIASGNRAFCWGKGDLGQLGTGRIHPKSYWPRRVAGGLSLDRVTAGRSHTCAEATDNRAYCWGYNYEGRLGDGTQTQRLAPVPVAGGLFFAQLTTGDDHTCGKTPAAAAYCWGDDRFGQLGNGEVEGWQLTPSPVTGPL
jgi:alpha-tubulin suppressor-like RCC1 family protein